MLSDAHLHLADYLAASGLADPPPGTDALWCLSAHEPAEFLAQERAARARPGRVWLSFGIHPQEPVLDHAGFLEGLARDGRISAIGECGFDLFDQWYKATLAEQRVAWDMQAELALSSGLPLVVHCRKALHFLFADERRLKRARAVAFHGWPGSAREARSFLDKGINAYFCAGKGLLRGDRSLMETVRSLPVDRLLTETDAPWMRDRDRPYTEPSEIAIVAARAASLAGMPLGDFERAVEANFRACFGACPEFG